MRVVDISTYRDGYIWSRYFYRLEVGKSHLQHLESRTLKDARGIFVCGCDTSSVADTVTDATSSLTEAMRVTGNVVGALNVDDTTGGTGKYEAVQETVA